MSITCKNCGNVFEGNYCNNCGQPAKTHHINASFIAHDIQHGLFHYDGGLLYSAKTLFTRPGHMIREYLQGKRMKHYKPISMVLVIASLYGLLYHMLNINVFEGQQSDVFNYDDLNEWIAHHFAIITLATIPLYSVSSYLVFRKQGYNFTEHIILNSFCSTQRLWVRILALPLLLIPKEPVTVNAIMRALMFVDIILMFWTYSQFFNTIKRTRVVVLTVLNFIVFYVLFTILLVAAVLVYSKTR